MFPLNHSFSQVPSPRTAKRGGGRLTSARCCRSPRAAQKSSEAPEQLPCLLRPPARDGWSGHLPRLWKPPQWSNCPPRQQRDPAVVGSLQDMALTREPLAAHPPITHRLASDGAADLSGRRRGRCFPDRPHNACTNRTSPHGSPFQPGALSMSTSPEQETSDRHHTASPVDPAPAVDGLVSAVPAPRRWHRKLAFQALLGQLTRQALADRLERLQGGSDQDISTLQMATAKLWWLGLERREAVSVHSKWPRPPTGAMICWTPSSQHGPIAPAWRL